MEHHAATVCWLSTVAIFRHQSILRNLICRLATRREWRRLEQRLERAANLAGVAARQVGGDHRFIHLRAAAADSAEESPTSILRPGVPEQGGAGHGERDRPRRSSQRALLGAIAIATPGFAAPLGSRSERSPQPLVHGRLDGDTDVLVDQFAQRDGNGFDFMRSDRLLDTLAHRAFLRWPPAGAAGWSGTSRSGRMRHFLLSTRIGTPPDSAPGALRAGWGRSVDF